MAAVFTERFIGMKSLHKNPSDSCRHWESVIKSGFGFACPPGPKPSNSHLLSSIKFHKTKAAKGLITLGLLAGVAAVDFFTANDYTLFLFYLLPVLYLWRWAGQGAAFAMAFVCTLIWLLVNIAEGQVNQDYLMIFSDTIARLAVFLMIIILLSTRRELQALVRQRTEKLQREIEERTQLEKELLGIAEAEQRRIGQDLHDSLGQHLTGIALAGKVLVKKLEDKSSAESGSASQLVQMTEGAIEITRKLARSLHPIEMRSDGLADALQNLAANISKTSGVECIFLRSGGELTLEIDTCGQLFRIAQEAVSNALRHGRASQIIVSLEGSGDKVLLSVTDNGAGLPATARTKNGMGLRIMDYRARMIGAKFDIQNLPAGGARAVCILNPGHSDTEFYAAKN